MSLPSRVTILPLFLALAVSPAIAASKVTTCAAYAPDEKMVGNSPYVTAAGGHCWWDVLRLGGNLGVQAAGTTVQRNDIDFDSHDMQLRQLNVNVRARLDPYTLAYIDLHYGNNDIFRHAFRPSANGGANILSSVDTAGQNTLEIDQAYGFFTNRKVSPVYVKLGNSYLDFGRYDDPYTSLPSLTQVLTQVARTNAGSGFVANNGLYASAAWFKRSVDTPSSNHLDAYTLRLGYQKDLAKWRVDGNIAFIDDIRNVYEALNGTQPLLKQYFMADLSNDSAFPHKQGAVHAQAKFSHGAWGLTAQFTEVLGQLNAANTEPLIAGGNLSYHYHALGHNMVLRAEYEAVNHGEAVMLFDQHVSGSVGVVLGHGARAKLHYARYRGTDTVPNGFANNPRHMQALLASLDWVL